MEDQYYRQEIEMIIDIESELYKRIERVAIEQGLSIAQIVQAIESIGVHRHMSNNLKFIYEKQGKECR